MPPHALYDVLYSFKHIHKVVLTFAKELDEQHIDWISSLAPGARIGCSQSHDFGTHASTRT